MKNIYATIVTNKECQALGSQLSDSQFQEPHKRSNSSFASIVALLTSPRIQFEIFEIRLVALIGRSHLAEPLRSARHGGLDGSQVRWLSDNSIHYSQNRCNASRNCSLDGLRKLAGLQI